MYIDAEERKKELMDKNEMKGLMFKMEDDPRITKVGRFIRKTSMDQKRSNQQPHNPSCNIHQALY